MRLPIQTERCGMTLVELLVALALSSLILVMISGLYLFSNKILIKFQTRSYFNDERILLETALSEKLGRLERILLADENAIYYAAFNGSTVSLEASSDGNLSLDGKQILPEGFNLDDFRIKYFARKINDDGTYLYEAEDKNDNFKLDGEELESIVLVELWYRLTYKDISRDFKLIFTSRTKL